MDCLTKYIREIIEMFLIIIIIDNLRSHTQNERKLELVPFRSLEKVIVQNHEILYGEEMSMINLKLICFLIFYRRDLKIKLWLCRR